MKIYENSHRENVHLGENILYVVRSRKKTYSRNIFFF